MSKKLIPSLCLYSLFIMFIFAHSCYSQENNNFKPAEPGQLDYNFHDAPLSYIDRYPHQQDVTPDSPEKQQQNFQILNEYVQAQKAQEAIKKQQALGSIDKTISDLATLKDQYDSSRKSYNYNQPYYDPYYYHNQFTTQIHPRPYYNPCPAPQQSGCWGYQPYMNIFNVPGYLNNIEHYYDGLDNDNDGFVDEGFSHGNIQIILGDTGVNKDDVWNLYVDGSYMGTNSHGRTRTWDLTLYPGAHNITLTGASIPDGSGTYSIIFRKAQVISGPPLIGENFRQGESQSWLIKVY